VGDSVLLQPSTNTGESNDDLMIGLDDEVFATAGTPGTASTSGSVRLSTRDGGTESSDSEDYDSTEEAEPPTAISVKDGMAIPKFLREKTNAIDRLRNLSTLFRQQTDSQADNKEANEIMERYPELKETTAGKLIRTVQLQQDDVETTDAEG
jgi:hypothetical protein